MSFYFEKYDNHSEPYERAIVHVSIHPEYPILKVDVDLDSLPDKEQHKDSFDFGGFEVVVNFKVENFDNDNTFYTDSNGLQMQKRVLNQRESWKFQN